MAVDPTEVAEAVADAVEEVQEEAQHDVTEAAQTVGILSLEDRVAALESTAGSVPPHDHPYAAAEHEHELPADLQALAEAVADTNEEIGELAEAVAEAVEEPVAEVGAEAEAVEEETSEAAEEAGLEPDVAPRVSHPLFRRFGGHHG